MASYKVPQDVEADDKLIGPFSFRQFVYLIIVAVAIALGYGLSRLFVPLAIIPLPVVLFFGALALPLRKDQPMETYMAAIVSFYLKPRRRLWQPDGVQSLIEITAPKSVEVQRTKDLSQTEAQKRLSYLADIVDTRGWSVRGVTMPETASSMQSDVFYDAQQAQDVLDEGGGVARSFDAMLTHADDQRRQAMVERLQGSAPATATSQPEPTMPPTYTDPYTDMAAASEDTDDTPAVNFTTLAPSDTPVNFTPASDPHFSFNPYPESMRQRVIHPIGDQPAPRHIAAQSKDLPVKPPAVHNQESTTSEKPVSPDIINLANNPDLSIETIAHEARRIHQKAVDDDEVVISLR